MTQQLTWGGGADAHTSGCCSPYFRRQMMASAERGSPALPTISTRMLLLFLSSAHPGVWIRKQIWLKTNRSISLTWLATSPGDWRCSMQGREQGEVVPLLTVVN